MKDKINELLGENVEVQVIAPPFCAKIVGTLHQPVREHVYSIYSTNQANITFELESVTQVFEKLGVIVLANVYPTNICGRG